MVWRKRKLDLSIVDSKIVKSDFLIAEGSTLNFHSEDAKENTFGKSLMVPIFYIFKVHRNHPMRVTVHKGATVNIYPLSGYNFSKKNQRFPAEVHKDKMDYDLVAFMMMPYNSQNMGTGWKKYEVPKGFVPVKGKKRDASLFYAAQDYSLHPQDSLVISQVTPSQVIYHLGAWMYDGRKVILHENTFNQKLEGRVEIPNEIRSKIFPEITATLQKRYKTRLVFDKFD